MDPAAAFRDAFESRLRRRRWAVALGGARRGGRRALGAALAILALLAMGILPPPGGAVLTAGLFLAFLALLMPPSLTTRTPAKTNIAAEAGRSPA